MNLRKDLITAIDAITLRQLRALDQVAGTGSITAAAERLSLTPPAVHTQLKNLRNIVGAEVLERGENGRFAPTAEGRLLIEAWRKSTAAIGHALREVEALRRGDAGFVSLGVASTGKYFAPGIVARLNQMLPGIEVSLTIGNRGQMIEGLEEGTLDLVIMGRPPRHPPNEAFGLVPHAHVMIAAPGNPLAGRADLTPEEILGQRIILREEGSGTRILAMRYLDRIGNGAPYDTLVMGSNETIKQSVRAGLGVSIISAHTCIDELAAGQLVQLRAPRLPIWRQWFLLHRLDLNMTPAVHRVSDLIRAEAAAMTRADEVSAVLE